jgi:hypothetical protein
MTEQAPNIDIQPGGGSRLVYDKARRTIVAAPNERQKANQELFERLRLLVIQHGTQEDVDALHELRERFNRTYLHADEDATVTDRLFDTGEKKDAGNG